MTEENKALEVAIAQLQRQYGQGSVIRLGTTNVKPWDSIPPVH
jgi:RecA/RadA recombinase